MLPTYKENGINFINRLAYVWSQPRRGDVVGIRLAGVHIMFMKRIIGLPGENVAFHEGHAIIDGVVLDEPYVKRPCDWVKSYPGRVNRSSGSCKISILVPSFSRRAVNTLPPKTTA